MTPHNPASTLQANFQVWFIIMMPSLHDFIKQDPGSLSSPVSKTDVLVATKNTELLQADGEDYFVFLQQCQKLSRY